MQQVNKEIFQNYEIKNWDYTPFFYKLLGGVAIFNILAILIVGQTNLLTRKGCDSPMVSRVCQVLDTVYVGSVLLGTDRDYVDKDYTKTELADADITYIDVSGQEPPLKYPEGYFALANPNDDFAVMQNPINDFSMMNPVPGITTNPTITGGTDLLNTPQVTPTPNNNAVTGMIPTSPFSMSDVNPVPPPIKNRKSPRISTPKMPRNTSPNPIPKTDDNTVAENKSEDKSEDKNQPEPKSDPVAEVEINRKPIKDLGVFVNGLVKDEKIKFSLETPFIAKAKGKLTKEGKLDPKSFKMEASSSDENMKEVVLESIEAINDAGYLQYLKVLSGKDLNLVLSQDNESITAVVQSELESDTRAKSIKSGLDLLISVSKMKKNSDDPNDKDDLEILKSATVENDGKKIIIKFAIPKPLAQEMIKRKLLEEANKPQTNNTAQSVNNSQTVTK